MSKLPVNKPTELTFEDGTNADVCTATFTVLAQNSQEDIAAVQPPQEDDSDKSADKSPAGAVNIMAY